MEEHVVLRAATDEDAERLAAFLNACTLTYQGVARSSPADARAQLHKLGTDPAADSRLALSGDEIVGFGQVWEASDEEVRLFARTHPDAAGRGIGSALLEFCETRAQQLVRDRPRELTMTSWAADDRAPDLLVACGFAPVRYFLQMKIAAEAILPRGAWPAHIDVDAFSEGGVDDDALYDAWRDAFAGHWGQIDQGAESFWKERRDPAREIFPFDASLWFVATLGGDVVGFSLCEQNVQDPRKLGRVAELGVVKALRGQGLGYALLTHGLHELRERGAEEIALDVDAENVTSALRLYRKAGMIPHPSFTIWGKQLQPAGHA
jgi:mycothiol synthase